MSCHFIPLKPLTLRMDHALLLDVLTSLPVSHAVLPRAVCFATSRPENHAICSFIDSSGYASGPIRMFLIIDYIIISDTARIVRNTAVDVTRFLFLLRINIVKLFPIKHILTNTGGTYVIKVIEILSSSCVLVEINVDGVLLSILLK